MRLAFVAIVASGCIPEPGGFVDTPPIEGDSYIAFGTPEAVAIRGYTGSAMEPFVTRDGAFLLFNNSNDPAVDTNIQIARRVDAVTFDYLGELAGVDSPALDGVPTLDRDGNLYFVSTRDYDASLSTIFHARFEAGVATGAALVPEVSRVERLVVNFDVEVSADGSTLYFVDAAMSRDGVPQHADLVMATRDASGGFVRRADSAALLANVSSSALEYAAAISPDELELFFTRVGAITADARPTIYRTARASIDEPFGVPQHVDAAAGFVEGPTLAPDGALYYHRCDAGQCSIFRIAR